MPRDHAKKEAQRRLKCDVALPLLTTICKSAGPSIDTAMPVSFDLLVVAS